MNKFKKDDIVFIKHINKFAQVYRDPLTEEYIRVKVINSKEPKGYFVLAIEGVVLVDPDTPQNRLLTQLKYG